MSSRAGRGRAARRSRAIRRSGRSRRRHGSISRSSGRTRRPGSEVQAGHGGGSPARALQGGARLDAELLDEETPRLAIDLERLCLATRAVERQHELRAQPFAEGVLANERLELADELCEAAERKVGFDAPLERREAELFEAENLRLRERLVREVGERRVRARGREPRGGVALRVSGAACCASSTSCSKRRRSSSSGVDSDQVARLLRDDHVAAERAPCGAGRRGTGARLRAVLGGSAPQSSSISRSAETTSFARVSSRASSARCLGPPSGSGRPPRRPRAVPGSETPRCLPATLTPVAGSAEAQRCLSAGRRSIAAGARSGVGSIAGGRLMP